MSGIGAWSLGYYQYGEVFTDSARHTAGLKAFKQALIDNNFGANINVDSATFGLNMKKRVKQFQTARALTSDGVIGPVTARYLFRLYAHEDEQIHMIPSGTVIRLIGHESGCDPVAQGYVDAHDEGLAQINLPSHPAVSLTEAWTPAYAISYAAQNLSLFYEEDRPDWDGAIASWNVGTVNAELWVDAGKPTSGHVVNGVDWFARAYAYVQGVKNSPA